MCAVSNIIGYERDRWPIEPKPWVVPDSVPYPYSPPDKKTLPYTLPYIPEPRPVPVIIPRDPTPEEIKDWIKKNKNWSPEKYEQLMKLIEEAKKIDAMHGEADCEDPLKLKFLKELEELVDYMKKYLKD